MTDYSWLNFTNLALFLGAVSVYCLLPGSVSKPWKWFGALVGVSSCLLGISLAVVHLQIHPENLLFLLFSSAAIIGGVLMVVLKNPAHGAICFAITITSTGGLFLLLAAPLVMAATIIVYAGAIIVTFLFLLMLAQQHGANPADQRTREPVLSTFCGFLLAAVMIHLIQSSFTHGNFKSRQAVEKTTLEIQQALSEKDLEVTKAKLLNNDESVVVRLKTAFGGSGPWVERIENEVQKDGAFNLSKAKSLEELHIGLNQLLVICKDYLDDQVLLRPNLDSSVLVSPFSGAQAGIPPDQIRKDRMGRPAMPAENTAFLGKSLFTDYLIAVELVGVLLLIATIGAIVIAKTAPGKEGV